MLMQNWWSRIFLNICWNLFNPLGFTGIVNNFFINQSRFVSSIIPIIFELYVCIYDTGYVSSMQSPKGCVGLTRNESERYAATFGSFWKKKIHSD